MWDSLESPDDPTRFAMLNNGRRWGKTRLGTNWIFYRAMKGQMCFSVSPDYPRSHVIWRRLVQMANMTPGTRVYKSDRLIEMPSGGWIQQKSADNPDSLRSEGLDAIFGDEVAYWSKEAWTEALRATLVDRQGSALLATTPDGYNWWHDLFMLGQPGGDPLYKSFNYASHTNPFLPNAELDRIRNEVSEVTYGQEYLALFTTAQGRVFGSFSRDTHVREACVYDDRLPLDLSIDFGSRTSAFGIYQRNDQEKRKIGEGRFEGQGTAESLDHMMKLSEDMVRNGSINVCENLPKDWAKKVGVITCDPAGDRKNSSIGKNVDLRDVNIVRNMMSWARVVYTTDARLTGIEAGCSRMRDRLLTMTGRVRYFINPACKHTIAAFEKYSYPEHKSGTPEKAEPIKDGINDHHIDEERYHENVHYHLSQPKFLAERPY